MIHSEAPKIDKWFFQVIQGNEKITDEQLSTLTPEQQLFCTDMIPRVLQETAKEWVKEGHDEYPDDDLGNDRVPCSLCHTLNRKVYFIQNRLNGNRLNVGSTCITKFDIENFEGKSDADLKKLSRESRLAKTFPKIFSILHRWSTHLATYPVVVPSKLHDPYDDLGTALESLIAAYLSGKNPPKFYDQVRNILDAHEDLLKRIDVHVKSELANVSPFTATRAVGAYLKSISDTTGYSWLQEDGAITIRTAHRIREKGFMNAMFPFIKEHLDAKLGISMIRADTEKAGYLYKGNARSNVTFFVPHDRDFFFYCGFLYGNMDEDNALTLDELVYLSSVEVDKDSIIYAMQQFNRTLRGSGWTMIDEDLEYNEVFARNAALNEIRALELKQFIHQNRRMLIGPLRSEQKPLVTAISRGKSLTLDQYRERRESRFELQREGRGQRSYD